MSFNKHFYKQFGDDIKEEVGKYDSRQENTTIKFKKCPHKQVAVKEGILRCKCGATWRGPRIAELYKQLTKEPNERRKR